MPYEITTKDGITIRNIPDDVPPDSQTLKDRVAKIRAENPAPVERSQTKRLADAAVRGGGPIAAGAVLGAAAGAPFGGVGAVPGAVAGAGAGALATFVGDPVARAVNKLFGTNLTTPSEAINHLMLKAGIGEAETPLERVVQAGAGGAAGAAGIASAAGSLANVASTAGRTNTAAVLGKLAEQPGLQTVAGAAGGLSGQLAAEGGATPNQQLAASLIGGTGGALLGGAAANAARAARTQPPAPTPAAPPAITPLPADQLAAVTRKAAESTIGGKSATRKLAEQTIPDKKIIESAKRLGIADYLQPDHVTTNQAYREMAQAIKSVPGSINRAAELEGLDSIARRADKLVDEFGGSADLSKLDAGLKTRMSGTQLALEKKADGLYEQVRAAIPAKTTVQAGDTLSFLQKHADDLGGADRLLPVERKLLASLDSQGKPLTYAYLDQTRKQIGQAMRKSSGPFADSESGMLKKLYSTLSNDQEVAAVAAGQGDLFKAAKSAVSVRKGLEDDMVALFGKQLDKSIVGDLSKAMTALPKGDTSKLINMLKAIPEDMRKETVASGLSTAFNISSKNQNLSFTNYANWYDGLLKNKQAYSALMTNLPKPARKQLSDLYRVSKGISQATKERITTGRLMAVKDELRGADNLMANIYSVAKRSAAGLGAEAVTTSVGLPGAGISAGIASALTKGKPNTIKAADALISSPEFDAAIRAVGTPGAGQSAAQLARSRAFKEFAKSVKDPLIISDPQQWISRAIAGTAIDEKRQEPRTNRPAQ